MYLRMYFRYDFIFCDKITVFIPFPKRNLQKEESN